MNVDKSNILIIILYSPRPHPNTAKPPAAVQSVSTAKGGDNVGGVDQRPASTRREAKICGANKDFGSHDAHTGWKRESRDIWGTREKSFHFPTSFSMHNFKARPTGRRNADITGKEVSAIDHGSQSLLTTVSLNFRNEDADRMYKTLQNCTQQYRKIIVTKTSS